MKTILHIGDTKTGTTSLQVALASSRDYLIQHGVLYPSHNQVSKHAHHFLAVLCESEYTKLPNPIKSSNRYKDYTSARKTAEEFWSDILSQIKNYKPDLLVLSSEVLSKKGEKLKELKNRLDTISSEIVVIEYLRKPSDYYLSLLQQKLKWNSEVLQPARGPYNNNLKKIINNLEYLFGPESLSLQKFDRNSLIRGNIISDFISRYLSDNNIKAEELNTRGEENLSLSGEGIWLLQKFMELYEKTINSGSTYLSPLEIVQQVEKADQGIGTVKPRLKPDIQWSIDHSSPDLIFLRDQYGIAFDGIDYDSIRPKDKNKDLLPSNSFLKIEEIIDIDAEKLKNLVLSFRELDWVRNDKTRAYLAENLLYHTDNTLTRDAPKSRRVSAKPDNTANLRICYYAIFKNREKLTDHIVRAAWYLSYMEPQEIIFLVSKDIQIDYSIPEYFDPMVEPFVLDIKNKLRFITVDDNEAPIEKYINQDDFDIVLLWDAGVLEKRESKNKFEEFRKKKTFWKVDIEKIRHAGSFYIKAGTENYPDRARDIEENRKKFHSYAQRFSGYNGSCVFCTGPQIARYKEFNFDNQLSIICNSIIFDNELMEHVKPQILCFGDPIFHFGPSRYTGEFYRKLRETVNRYNLLILIPFNYHRIFNHNFPEFRDQSISIPFDYEKPYSYDLLNDFYINPFGNILNMLMLPVASTFTNNIYIIGADGRKESENKYFWKHNKKTQINDQMTNIQRVHPSFFNIDYDDYYESHKQSLEKYIEEGELKGNIYTLLTPSYIPCLGKRRYFDENREPKINKRVAIHDPGFSEHGHNTYFNIHIAKILSKCFTEVVLFDEKNTISSVFNDKPDNVEIIQLPETLSIYSLENELSHDLYRKIPKEKKKEEFIRPKENKFFTKLWDFIDSNGCSLIFFTSEGKLSSLIKNSIFSSTPNIPFTVIIHIAWYFDQRIEDIDFVNAVKKADCLFVLENYLVDFLKDFHSNMFRLPYLLFDDCHQLPQKREKNYVTFGTIGIINQRRNIPFLLNALNQYQGSFLEYHLFGKPIGEEGNTVKTMAGEFDNASHVRLKTNFNYLSDQERMNAGRNCDFILLAYDEKRKYQAPGALYDFTKCGTPIVVPNIEPFTLIEKEYPGLFIFYDSLSMESLHQVLHTLASKGDEYEKLKNKALQAMQRLILDNLHNRQISRIHEFLTHMYRQDTLLLPMERTREIITQIIDKLCRADARMHKLFSDKVTNEILSNEIAIKKSAGDEYIQRIARGSNVLDEIIENGIITLICDKDDVFSRLLQINLTECITNDEDLIFKICPEYSKDIFKSNYNKKSRSDKFFGFWGKLFGAYEIYKAANEFEYIDKPRLEELKDIHKGKRGFVICNGPSLNSIDLNLLKDEITIGTNGLYLLFENGEFRPDYYVIEDDLIGEDRQEDINSKINGPIKFFSQRLAYCVERADDVVFLRHSPEFFPWSLDMKMMNMDRRFSQDISMASYGGNTVTYTCLQIMYHLGIREVYIIGADHNYEVPDRYENHDANENYVIDSQEDDQNHFNPAYFGQGYRWHNPKVHKLEQTYKNAKKFFEHNGGMIFNATIGGYLEVFDRVNFYDILKEGYRNPALESFQAKFKPITYTGPFIGLDFSFYLENKFKRIANCSFELEILLNSTCHLPNYNEFNETSPPTPLLLNPLIIFQMSHCVYRIKCRDLNHYFRFFEHEWNKINLKYDIKQKQMLLSLNNKIIHVFKGVENGELTGLCKIGKGHHSRYWQGKIAYVELYRFDKEGEKTPVFKIDASNYEKYKQGQETAEATTSQHALTEKRKDQQEYSTKSLPGPDGSVPLGGDRKRQNGAYKNLFVVGNGPSLRNFPFENLIGIPWIGMNAAYRYWHRVNIYPSCYVCLDTVVIESHKNEIYRLIQNRHEYGIKLFFLRIKLLKTFPDLLDIPEVLFIEDYFNSPYFENITNVLTTGSFSVLLGAMIGYRTMHLLGFDLGYVDLPEAQNVKGYVLEMSSTPDKNPNYFIDDYQVKGDRFNVPDSTPNLHHKSWIIVKERIQKFGVSVFNCSKYSNLEIFDCADIEDIFPIVPN